VAPSSFLAQDFSCWHWFFLSSSLAGWIFRQVKKLSLLASVTAFWQRGSKLCSARFEDSILPFFNLFCLLDIFSAFYYLICFLIFCLAFWLDRSFVNRYFAILIRFQFLVLSCFLSLNSWGRAASSERTIAIIVCMFCGPIVLAHGCYMTREFRREMHFFAFCKLAEKYFLVGMNSLGTLRRVYWEWLYANSSSWCSLEATHLELCGLQ